MNHMTAAEFKKTITVDHAAPDAPIADLVDFYNSIDDMGMFTKSASVDCYGRDDCASIVISITLKSDEMELVIRPSKADRYSGADMGAKLCWDGDTNYKRGDKWFTFSRRGIDSSFRGHNGTQSEYGESTDINLTVIEEYEKVQEKLKVEMVTVPGINTAYTKKFVEQAVSLIKTGKVAHFTPAGFGTGFTFAKVPMSQWSKRAPAIQAAFFGVKDLYVDQFDCD